MKMKHLDCRNYAPVDVVKGICHETKETIPGDEETCAKFEKMPKCKFCARFTPGAIEYTGVCEAASSKPMTYPDLIGITCEFFEWKKD
jgi:4-hydroxyphenylacetate decarboxylase small subunit